VRPPLKPGYSENHIEGYQRAIEVSHYLSSSEKTSPVYLMPQLRKTEPVIQDLPDFKIFASVFRVTRWLRLNCEECCHSQSPIRTAERARSAEAFPHNGPNGGWTKVQYTAF
jgi:hypothetical protein